MKKRDGSTVATPKRERGNSRSGMFGYKGSAQAEGGTIAAAAAAAASKVLSPMTPVSLLRFSWPPVLVTVHERLFLFVNAHSLHACFCASADNAVSCCRILDMQRTGVTLQAKVRARRVSERASRGSINSVESEGVGKDRSSCESTYNAENQTPQLPTAGRKSFGWKRASQFATPAKIECSSLSKVFFPPRNFEIGNSMLVGCASCAFCS